MKLRPWRYHDQQCRLLNASRDSVRGAWSLALGRRGLFFRPSRKQRRPIVTPLARSSPRGRSEYYVRADAALLASSALSAACARTLVGSATPALKVSARPSRRCSRTMGRQTGAGARARRTSHRCRSARRRGNHPPSPAARPRTAASLRTPFRLTAGAPRPRSHAGCHPARVGDGGPVLLLLGAGRRSHPAHLRLHPGAAPTAPATFPSGRRHARPSRRARAAPQLTSPPPPPPSRRAASSRSRPPPSSPFPWASTGCGAPSSWRPAGTSPSGPSPTRASGAPGCSPSPSTQARGRAPRWAQRPAEAGGSASLLQRC